MTGGGVRASGRAAFGVSRDSYWSHRAWKEALGIDVPLLSDWNGALAKHFGAVAVWRWMEGVPRAERVPRRRGRYGARIVAVRGRGRARLRRAARGRAGVAGLAVALYLGAGVLATSPAFFETATGSWATASRARGASRRATICRRSTTSGCPGTSSRAGARRGSTRTASSRRCEQRVNSAGWPFAAVFGPLQAVFGTVAGWNVFLLLTYVGAGGFAALWLRALGLPLGAALVGRARVRARAVPRRAVDRTPARADLDAAPARALRGRAAARLARRRRRSRRSRSPGQVHLALGAIPFVLAYAWARGRWSWRRRRRRRAWRRACSSGR